MFASYNRIWGCLFFQDVSLHHLIRQSGKPYAEEIAVFEKYFDKCRKQPDEYIVTNKQLKKYRRLLFKASVEELRHYEVVLATCAVGGNRKLIEGTEKTIFQVRLLYVFWSIVLPQPSQCFSNYKDKN